MNSAWKPLGAVCVLVIGVYAYMAQSSVWEMRSPDGADSNYNLLVQSFQAGQLSLKIEVPPGFARLTDPFDPVANIPYRGAPYRMNDLSYYNGRLYMYFGVTPALILFWPYVAVTGDYLFHRQAVLIFSTVGFLASVALLYALWRRYFSEVSVWVVAACALAMGLATCVPEQLSQADFYEVADTCGYMLMMLALGAIWCALHEPEQKKCRWLATASVAYGLAVGARPSLLFGAVILLLPMIQVWRERRQQVWVLLLAATGPILLIGLGLMLYNALRFDNPFEFGVRYQVNWFRPGTRHMFNLHYLWLNFRVYFLEPVRWSSSFPFLHEIAITHVPPGHAPTGRAYGVLTNVPLAWLALAAPLAWRGRSAEARSKLRGFLASMALLFGTGVSPLLILNTASFRYEVDFLPILVLLAVIGIFGLERTLANRPVQRRAVRWSWGLLLGLSVAFNLLASVEHYAEVHNNLGFTLWQAGKGQEAIREYEYALRLKPDSADAHVGLGTALVKLGRPEDAIRHWEEALRIRPDYAEAHYNLGVALQQRGRFQEAVEHYTQALRIKPDYAEVHNNLGLALTRLGRVQEALGHYEEALRIKPDHAETHYNFGLALQQTGKLPEAVEHFEQALRLKPDYVEAHYNLGLALAQLGRIEEAMGHWKQALQIKPDYVQAHFALGFAMEKLGRTPEAIEHYEQALRIKPDFAEARDALARLQAGQ